MNATVRYAILAVVGLVLAFYNPLTHLAANYNLEITVGGTAIYASLRSLTSVMSIVRDADVQASIGVASLATSPGQALQPVIVTLERMANLLFALVVLSGVLGFTLPIVASLGAIVLAVGASAKAVSTAMGHPLGGVGYRLARSAVTLGVLAAVCIPIAYAFAFFLGDKYADDAWRNAGAAFERQATSLSVEDVSGPVVTATLPRTPEAVEESSAEKGNVLDRIKDTIEGTIQGSREAVEDALTATTGFAAAVRDQFAASTRVVTDGIAMAADLFQASVDIGVAYLVKLIVLPLLILLGVLWIFRSLTQSSVITTEDARKIFNIRYVENGREDGAES